MASVADNGIRGRAGSLWGYLRTEAIHWRVAPLLAGGLFVLPLLGAVAIVLLRADSRAYRFVTDVSARDPARTSQSGWPSGPVPVPSGTVVMSMSSSRPLPPDTESASTGPTSRT